MKQLGKLIMTVRMSSDSDDTDFVIGGREYQSRQFLFMVIACDVFGAGKEDDVEIKSSLGDNWINS